MSLRDTVIKAMSDLLTVTDTAEGVLVTTSCLYPSNEFVKVHIAGGPNTYYVSDYGGALKDIEGTGVEPERDPMKSLKAIIAPQGMRFEGGGHLCPAG